LHGAVVEPKHIQPPSIPRIRRYPLSAATFVVSVWVENRGGISKPSFEFVWGNEYLHNALSLEIATHQPILRRSSTQGGPAPRFSAQIARRFRCSRHDVLEVGLVFKTPHKLKETIIN